MTSWEQMGMLPRVLGKRSFSPLSALVILSAALACSSGTETGNPSLTGSLSYTGYSSNPDDYGIGESGRVASLEAAWFALDRVATVDCEGDDDFDVPALGLGDHAAGNHNVTLFPVSAARFCSVRLPFLQVDEIAAGTGAPAALPGHALLLQGALADGTPFTILSDAHPVIELEAANGGFTIAEGKTDLLMAFDFARWLSTVDFTAASRNADEEIMISSADNSALLAAFEAQLPRGVGLYRDRDANGILDPEPELLAAPR